MKSVVSGKLKSDWLFGNGSISDSFCSKEKYRNINNGNHFYHLALY